jgi:signal transduction histidine kinase
MLHSQKMAAVGQLARKVAHSFTNALTGIRGNADLARCDEGTTSEVKQLMDLIIASADRLARLTGDLLAFSSPGSLRVHRLDLGKCIQGIERMLRETLGPSIQMWIETESGVGRVDLDPDRIEQAVVHLAINASEAMSGAGKLRITVRRADLSEAERRRLQATAGESDFHNGPFALLAVQDTGCGMSEEVASRLFEPFFTTKAHRENAGLGLATVYNIIRAHNGYIEVKTQPGRGTTFLIYMPVKEEPQAA